MSKSPGKQYEYYVKLWVLSMKGVEPIIKQFNSTGQFRTPPDFFVQLLFLVKVSVPFNEPFYALLNGGVGPVIVIGD